MNGLNKWLKATSVSNFDFYTLYAKLPHNKLLMVLKSLTDFCFDWRGVEYIAVNKYGARWAKNTKYRVICLNKQQIKDVGAYLLFNFYFTVGPKIFCQIIGVPMGLIHLLFLPTYIFYKSKWMNEMKKNYLIKARKLCYIFRFMDDLNSINDFEIFEINYSNNLSWGITAR